MRLALAQAAVNWLPRMTGMIFKQFLVIFVQLKALE